ncbi:hypothetical protein G7047_00635 [Diaphorobacter sp. HDW4A]|uniref:hypothetical protein n=1 Tax=Diaphorobacter sp. HDW4A TaxID=2714924 RepID=UPI001408D4FE|nr:hypothetical protein [Diaphorobacter sp. HDW4A]QIL78590.1 hypothetical protein G7047_00635 [Diaphorobacter sp. HDW4A]
MKSNHGFLKHWELIQQFDLLDAAMLMAGIEPSTKNKQSELNGRVEVYERAIAEAIQRANEYAWHHARQIDMLMLDSKINEDALNSLRGVSEIWEISGQYDQFLPTLEIRQSVVRVNEDPENVPILLPIDPWYTATVYGNDFNEWIQRIGIESEFFFKHTQAILVTTRSDNWDSEQSRLEAEKRSEAAIPLESANAFAEKIGISDMPLSTRERNTLLSIIAVLSKEAKIDYSRPAKAASLIKDLTIQLGLNVGESTIEGHLKRIPDALEARMK